ncbi:PAX3- and PAX7-binding protein 1 [Ixodes scapularis]|nr:PAX3- and PAX7-binding protein 1 [Ixodes scapularis]
MSLFRKPNRKFRQRLQHSDSEDEDEREEIAVVSFVEKSPPRPEPVSANISEAVDVDKAESKAPASLLSFGDDEDETEVFKVKKSSYSRRLAKQLERDRKKKLKEAVKAETKPEKEATPPPAAVPVEKAVESKSPRPFSDELEIKIKNTIKILNSEEMKDLDGSSGSDKDGDDNGEGIRFRRFKNVIQSGVIPDAATIYALKKQRQMAREMGDFVPLEPQEPEEKSRLTRNEDEDQSDEEEGRINFTVNTGALEKQRAREAMIQAQEENSNHENEHEDVAELERWEQEQMKKGVSTAPIVAMTDSSTAVPQPSIPNYFTNYPPAEADTDTVQTYQVPKDKGDLTTEMITKRVTDRLASVRELLALHEQQKTTALLDLEASAEAIEQLQEEQPKLAARFHFFQEMRGYATDLIECIDAKMPVLLALEGRMMSLLCQRSERLVQRRHQDIKDQAEECTLAVKNLKGAPNLADVGPKGNNSRNWRAAEREGRRVRRRKAREAKKSCTTLAHQEGMSTDDEQPDTEVLAFNKEIEVILDDARHVFEDVTEDFSSVTALKLKFERWKLEFEESYEQAYIPLCLVKLLVPFVRLQLVTWNPVDKPESLESCPWYEALLFYGDSSENLDVEDPDLCLIPRIVERVVLPKMAALAEKVWDPMSSNQTLNLVRTAKKLVEDYPMVGGHSRHMQNFLAKVAARIQRAIDEDVYIPLYPKEVLENRAGVAAAFFHRQFWSCLKLMKNVLSWQGLLAEDPLKELSLCSLLNRYLVFALQSCIGQRDTVEKCKTVVLTLPTSWIRGPGTPLPQLDLLLRFLKLYQQHLYKLSSTVGDLSELHGNARENLEEVNKLVASLTTSTEQTKSKGKK